MVEKVTTSALCRLRRFNSPLGYLFSSVGQITNSSKFCA
jgi:hypothetical protein